MSIVRSNGSRESVQASESPTSSHHPASSTEHPADTPRADWRLRLPFYYGWVITAALAVSLGFAYTTWYSFSVFFVALIEEFGWSRAASAGVFSFFVIAVGLAGTAAGVLADRYGPGKIGTIGALVLAAGLAACSQVSNLWQYYIMFGVVSAVGLACAGWIPCVTLTGRWFSARYGTAIGISSAGIGVGILVMVPATQLIIDSHGWRTAYLVLAALTLLVVVPIEAFVLRGRPEDIGLRRDGRKPEEEKPAGRGLAPTTSRIVDKPWVERVWTISTVMRTRRYWLIFLMLIMANTSAQMLMVHQVAYLVDGGYDKLFAASVMGLVGFFSIFGKAGWGWASDRLGREMAWTLGFVFLLGGIGLLVLTKVIPSAAIVYIYALFLALGYAVSPPVAPATAADVFAGRKFGSIYGTLGFGNAVGSAVGAFLAGLVFDVTGSYNPALVVAAIAAVTSVSAMWIAAPRKVRLVPGQVKRAAGPGD